MSAGMRQTPPAVRQQNRSRARVRTRTTDHLRAATILEQWAFIENRIGKPVQDALDPRHTFSSCGR